MSNAEKKPDPLAGLRMFSMKQASEVTTYHVAYLYRLARQNKFVPIIRIGPNRVGVRQRDLERWLSERPTKTSNDNEPAPDKGKD